MVFMCTKNINIQIKCLIFKYTMLKYIGCNVASLNNLFNKIYKKCQSFTRWKLEYYYLRMWDKQNAMFIVKYLK